MLIPSTRTKDVFTVSSRNYSITGMSHEVRLLFLQALPWRPGKTSPDWNPSRLIIFTWQRSIFPAATIPLTNSITNSKADPPPPPLFQNLNILPSLDMTGSPVFQLLLLRI